MRNRRFVPRSRPHRHLTTALGLLLLVVSASAGSTANNLARIEGDYTIAVHPQAFGFVVRNGRLHLKMGGIGGDGAEVPLIETEPGRFQIAPDHPNAFVFRLEDGEGAEDTAVGFTLFAMGNPIPGKRVAESDTPAATAETRVAADPAEPRGRTRADLKVELASAAAAHGERPDHEETRLRYARLLYETGSFQQAREVVAPLAARPEAGSEVLDLAGDLAYLAGDYSAAEKLYDALVEANRGNLAAQVRAKVSLLFTYYQTNRFPEVEQLAFPDGVVLPNADVMRAFDEPPYRAEWTRPERIARVPFEIIDPLPVFAVTVDGRGLQVLLDTGADTLILDDTVAAALEVEAVATAMGTFGGGLQQEISFGRVDSLTLGDVTLHGVPVTVLPTRRFSGAFGEDSVMIDGILGTSVLRQFLPTVDYAEGALVLRERTPEASRALRRRLAGRLAGQVPFVLHATHLMMARGALNGEENLTFFVDSGLASEAAFAAPPQTLALVGIPEPETRVSDESVGGGGGKFATGEFPIKRLALGRLEQSDLIGAFGVLTPESYRSYGFIQDGLLSHRFLRRYASWTIDFDAMEFLFEEAAPDAP